MSTWSQRLDSCVERQGRSWIVEQQSKWPHSTSFLFARTQRWNKIFCMHSMKQKAKYFWAPCFRLWTERETLRQNKRLINKCITTEIINYKNNDWQYTINFFGELWIWTKVKKFNPYTICVHQLYRRHSCHSALSTVSIVSDLKKTNCLVHLIWFVCHLKFYVDNTEFTIFSVTVPSRPSQSYFSHFSHVHVCAVDERQLSWWLLWRLQRGYNGKLWLLATTSTTTSS